jgi:hypothetical protein
MSVFATPQDLGAAWGKTGLGLEVLGKSARADLDGHLV